MNGKKRPNRQSRRAAGLLPAALAALLLAALLCAPQKAIPAGARAAEPVTLLVDGTALPGGLRLAGKVYAPAEAFIAALDGAFWAGEKADMRWESRRLRGRDCLCVEDFCAAYGIARYDEGGDCVWCSSAAGDWEAPAGIRVPVLMYHGVGDELWTTPALFTRPEDLRAQLTWLRENGWTPLFFADLKHADRWEKPVLLTFDDSFADNYTELFPILREFGVKATLFVIQGTLGWEHNLTEAQLLEMQASGLVDVQCHTQYHLYLDELSREQQLEELTWSKVGLTKLTGRIPFVIAYPAGREDESALAICREEYRFGVKMGGPCFVTGGDPLRIHRISVPRDMSLAAFSAALGG